MDLIKLKDIIAKHVDEKALVRDLAVSFIVPFLEKIVADSANKFDNFALGEIKKYIETLK